MFLGFMVDVVVFEGGGHTTKFCHFLTCKRNLHFSLLLYILRHNFSGINYFMNLFLSKKYTHECDIER